MGIRLSFPKKFPSAAAPWPPSFSAILRSPLRPFVYDRIKVSTAVLAKPLPPLLPPFITLFIAFPALAPAAARFPKPWIVFAMFSLISGAPDKALRNSITACDRLDNPLAVSSVFLPAVASLDSDAMNDVRAASIVPSSMNVLTAVLISGVSFFMPSAVWPVFSPAFASLAIDDTKPLRPLPTSPMPAISLMDAAMPSNVLMSNFDVSVLTKRRMELVN